MMMTTAMKIMGREEVKVKSIAGSIAKEATPTMTMTTMPQMKGGDVVVVERRVGGGTKVMAGIQMKTVIAMKTEDTGATDEGKTDTEMATTSATAVTQVTRLTHQGTVGVANIDVAEAIGKAIPTTAVEVLETKEVEAIDGTDIAKTEDAGGDDEVRRTVTRMGAIPVRAMGKDGRSVGGDAMVHEEADDGGDEAATAIIPTSLGRVTRICQNIPTTAEGVVGEKRKETSIVDEDDIPRATTATIIATRKAAGGVSHVIKGNIEQSNVT